MINSQRGVLLQIEIIWLVWFVKYWCTGLVSSPTYPPKASVFDNPGTRHNVLWTAPFNPENFPLTAIKWCYFSVSRIVHLHMDEVGFISQWRAILAGGLAGIAAALVTYPLEVAETRLIVQNCREPTYIGIVHTLSKIYSTEGLFALYRGFSLTMLGMFACSCRLFYFLCVVSFFFVHFLILVYSIFFFFHELIYWIFL